MMMTKRVLLVAAALSMAGCYQGLPEAEGDAQDTLPGRVPGQEGGADDSADDGPDSGEPGHQGEGEADNPPGRKVRRMSAVQFHQSLVTVTGQAWPLFDDYAGAMGRADFAEITAEGLELSVTFDKFVHDAALYTCNEAVLADIADAGGEMPSGEPGTLLRFASITDREPGTLRANLDYMMLRILGQQMRPGDDPRVDPWMNLLTTSPLAGVELDDATMTERWIAVCVGLVTHPDFVTY